MKIIYGHQREDRPLKPDEIQLDAGCLTAEPTRIPARSALPELQQADAALKEFNARTAAEQAKLAAAREAAVERQQRKLELDTERQKYADALKRAEDETKATNARFEELLNEGGNIWWRGGMMADHALEYSRRVFGAKVTERIIPQLRARLAEIDAELSEFK